MKRGKQVCRILKEIRKQIAEANDIEFITSECQYHGDCPGTCPKCESEVRYLEQQLAYRRVAGKAITLLGISTGALTMASLTSCANSGNKSQQEITVDTTANIRFGDISVPTEEDSVKSDTSIKTTQQPPLTLVVDPNPNIIPIEPEVMGISIVEPEVMGDVRMIEPEIEPEVEDTLMVAEQMPQFPGGQKELLAFISKTINYGPDYGGNGVQGRTIVQFVIDKEGNVVNPKVVRGVDRYLDKEALRVISLMPKWKPGVQNGKNVAVYYTVPVMFRLQ